MGAGRLFFMFDIRHQRSNYQTNGQNHHDDFIITHKHHLLLPVRIRREHVPQLLSITMVSCQNVYSKCIHKKYLFIF